MTISIDAERMQKWLQAIKLRYQRAQWQSTRNDGFRQVFCKYNMIIRLSDR